MRKKRKRLVTTSCNNYNEHEVITFGLDHLQELTGQEEEVFDNNLEQPD